MYFRDNVFGSVGMFKRGFKFQSVVFNHPLPFFADSRADDRL